MTGTGGGTWYQPGPLPQTGSPQSPAFPALCPPRSSPGRAPRPWPCWGRPLTGTPGHRGRFLQEIPTRTPPSAALAPGLSPTQGRPVAKEAWDSSSSISKELSPDLRWGVTAIAAFRQGAHTHTSPPESSGKGNGPGRPLRSPHLCLPPLGEPRLITARSCDQQGWEWEGTAASCSPAPAPAHKPGCSLSLAQEATSTPGPRSRPPGSWHLQGQPRAPESPQGKQGL